MSEERDRDAAIDAALDAAASGAPKQPAQEVSFKRQWDSDLDAELEAAMAGFDESAFEVNKPGRVPREERAGGMAPQGGRGQETRSGPQLGKVISVRGKSVFVDLGAKSEGVVPVEQFEGDLPEPGSMIEVRVDHFDTAEGILHPLPQGSGGRGKLGKPPQGADRRGQGHQDQQGRARRRGRRYPGVPPDRPDRHQPRRGRLDLRRQEAPRGRHRRQPAREEPRRLARELLEQERAEKREQTWKTLEEGQVHKGVVRTIKPFGAFVEFGGVDGLIHVSDMSWSRVSDPSALLKIGDEVEVKVLKIDRTTQKVGLGLKQLVPSPWDRVEENFHRGQTVQGKVTRLMDFGAFVEIAPGIEGLIHISELSPNRVRRVIDIVKPDQEVEVRIVKIDPEEKKMALSLIPLPTAAPAEEEVEEEEDDTPKPPRPEPKVPLKGGLGDRDPFLQPPKRSSK